jgi:hypothetical protein
MANRHLLEAGFEPSIDVRNWKEKGLDEKPKNKSMWQWQSEKRAEAILDTYKLHTPKLHTPAVIFVASKLDSSPDFGF